MNRFGMATLCASLLFAPSAHARETWLEATSPHFHLVGNAKAKDLKEIAQDFEKFRGVLRASIPDPDDAEPEVPITIFVVRKEKDLKALIPPFFEKRTVDVAGMFRERDVSAEIFVVLDVWGDNASTVYHEYHHAYFERSAPWAPLWLKEGLADLWGGTKIDGKTIELGRPETLPIAYLRSMPLLPIEKLLAVRGGSKEYTEWDRAGVFYCESTVFTHFLLLGQPQGEAKLQRFGKLMQEGVPQEMALAQAWGPLPELQKQFEAYLRNQSFGFERASLKEAVADVTVETREIAPERVAAWKAFAVAPMSQPELARPLVEESLKADSGDVIALEAGGMMERGLHDRAKSHEWFEKAAASPSADFGAHYLAAVTAERTREGALKDPAAVEAHLAKAVALNPRFAPALARDALLLAGSNADGAVKLALAAAKLEPGEPAYLVRAARVLRQTGHRADAAKLASDAALQALRIADGATNNDVCWNGALLGFADVVFAACENAVHLEPDDWAARDSRGLARALTGDRAGAAEDFRFAADHADGPDRMAFAAQRRAWAEKLAGGANPIDAAAVALLDDTFGR